MSANEELEEHSHHAKEPFDRRVAATMAILAAVLAVDSVLGHILTTEELLKQGKAADTWSQYQAKSIRRFSAEATRDLLGTLKADPALGVKYGNSMDRYKKESEEIQKEAQALDHESDEAGKKALWLHVGEVFLELSIVLSSLAILTKRNFIYWVGVIAGATGVVLASLEFFA